MSRLELNARRRIRPHFETLEDRTTPATFHALGVADGAAGSLRAAIIAANANAEADTIKLPAGLFVLKLAGRGEDAAATGDLDLTKNGDSVLIRGAGPGVSIIDADELDRVFHIRPGVKVTLQDLTIRNGFAGDSPSGPTRAEGGGIFNAGELTLFNVIVERNEALGSNNVSVGPDAGGGGIFNRGTLSMNYVLVRDNVARGAVGTSGASGGVGGSASGGGIQSVSAMVMKHSAVVNNHAHAGNGGNASSSATGGVGGDAFGGGLDLTAAASLFNSTISGNVARGGDGGTGTSGAGLRGVAKGGGLHSTANLTIRNCTIAGNTAEGRNSTGGGVVVSNTVTAVFIRSVSSLFADNVADANADVSGNFTKTDHTLVESAGAGGIVNNVNGNKVGQDPLLRKLSYNGGLTPTHSLRTGSVAIDAGANPLNATTDQRGSRFARKSGAAVDIGAFELDVTRPAKPVVKSPNAAVSVTSSTFTITGLAEAGSHLRLFLDSNENGKIDADETLVKTLLLKPTETAFSLPVPLKKGMTHRFLITAIDGSGNESGVLKVPAIKRV